MKPICLIASARTYSNYVFRYVRNYNRENFGILATWPSEFLTENDPEELELRLHWLTECRKHNVEFSIKIMSNFVSEEWVKEFYENWRIVKLVRKNTYRQLLSYIFVILNGHKSHHTSLVESKIHLNKIQIEKWQVEVSYDIMRKHLEFLPEAEIWYSEEFDKEVETPYVSTEEINYEDYIENLLEVQMWLDELDEENNLLGAF